MIEIITDLLANSGFAGITIQHLIMLVIACIFFYLAIAKGCEPYLLIPIAFGMLLVNLPGVNLMDAATDSEAGGLFYYLYQGINLVIYPPLIFLCLGASIDFGPLIANPKTMLLGGAAQVGVLMALLLAIALGFTGAEAASIGIIGGADGPTTIFLTGQLAPHLLSTVALAAYSYMALVPIIQPPIIRLLTTKKERMIKMEQLRSVTHKEKIIFPIAVTLVVVLLVPTAAPLIGMLMFGNLIKESGKVPKLVDVAQNSLMYILTILLGLSVGAKASAELFLTPETLKITLLGLIAFAFGTASGVLFGKLMCKWSGGKINPVIGAAGVSAIPMSARVVQQVGLEENPSNFLLMHAMGPNVAGIVGSAILAGLFIQFLG